MRSATVADAAAISRVHIASWQAAYRGIVPDDVLDNLDKTYARRLAYWMGAIAGDDEAMGVFVALDGNEVVGFANAGKSRDSLPAYDGEIYAIYALARVHGRGIGKALMRACAEYLVAAGFGAVMLWVLADNPTRGFYEHLGGAALHQKNITVGVDLVEVAYGWPDVKVLLAATTVNKA